MTAIRARLAARREDLRRELGELDDALVELDGSHEQPTPVPFDAFLNQPDLDIQWILGGVLVPQSVNLVAAGGGVGKTTLLAQIALSLGAGKDVLGFHVYRPHTVLMVQAEGAREAFRQRLKRAALRAIPDVPFWERKETT